MIKKQAKITLIVSGVIFTGFIGFFIYKNISGNSYATGSKVLAENKIEQKNVVSKDYSTDNSNDKPKVINEPVENKPKQQFTELEYQVYDYMEDIWQTYEDKYDSDKAEALVLIETSKEFKKPILEIFKTYTDIQSSKYSLTKYTDALAIENLLQIGFTQKQGKWYYGGNVVDMGADISLYEKEKATTPQQGREIAVSFKTKTTVSELKKVKFRVETNLPDGMTLMLRLTNSDKSGNWGGDYNINNGTFETDWFYDDSRPGDRMKSGDYTLEISSTYILVQPQYIKDMLGNKGENLTGKYVENSVAGGNLVRYTEKIHID